MANIGDVRRVVLEFVDTETRYWLTTKEIVAILGLKVGQHPLILGISAFETITSGSAIEMHVDPNNLTTPTAIRVNGGGTDNRITYTGGNRSRKFFYIIGSGSYIPKDYYTGGVHCWDSLLFIKSTSTTDWWILLEYVIADGNMMWHDEIADLLKDKATSTANKTAGTEFAQVGDYYQLNKRTY